MELSLVLGIILIIVLVGCGAVLSLLLAKLNELKDQQPVALLKSDVTELSRTITAMQQSVGDKLERCYANVSPEAALRECQAGGRCNAAPHEAR